MPAGTIVRAAHYPGRAPIDSYGNGGFRFAGMSHRGALLCLPSSFFPIRTGVNTAGTDMLARTDRHSDPRSWITGFISDRSADTPPPASATPD